MRAGTAPQSPHSLATSCSSAVLFQVGSTVFARLPSPALPILPQDRQSWLIRRSMLTAVRSGCRRARPPGRRTLTMSHTTYPPPPTRTTGAAASTSGPGADPSRLRPGTLSRTGTDASFSSTASRSSWTGGPGSKRKLLAGKALDLSSKVLSKSADFLAVHEYDNMAASLSRAEGKVRSAKEARDWGEYDGFVSNRDMQVGGRRTPQPSPGLTHEGSDYVDAKGGSVTPDKGKKRAAAAAGASYLSYFGRQQREARNRQVFTEEHIVCFPGYAALRSPSHAQAGDIDIFLSGYCFRSRPADSAPTRSQKLLYGMARKWTGLPSLPSVSGRPDGTMSPTGSQGVSSQDEREDSASVQDDGEDVEAAMREKDLIDFDEAADRDDAPKSPAEAKERTFAALLEMAEQEVAEEAEQDRQAGARPRRDRRFTSEPEEMEHAASAGAALKTPSTSPPPKPPKPAPLQVPNGASPPGSKVPGSQASHRSTPSISSVASSAGSASRPMARRNSFDGYDLKQLHHNLKDRLQGFFGQKMEGRRVAIEVWPAESPAPATESHSAHPQHALHHSFSSMLAFPQRPLLTRVIMTKAGGAWSEKLTLPWQTLEAYLKVRAGRQDRSPEVGVTRLKVRVELLRDETLLDKAWATAMGEEGQQERGQERRIVEREVAVTPAAGAQGFHLVSDIDDTIKRTEVVCPSFLPRRGPSTE